MNTLERKAAKKLLETFVDGTMDNATISCYESLMRAVSQRLHNEDYKRSMEKPLVHTTVASLKKN